MHLSFKSLNCSTNLDSSRTFYDEGWLLDLQQLIEISESNFISNLMSLVLTTGDIEY